MFCLATNSTTAGLKDGAVIEQAPASRHLRAVSTSSTVPAPAVSLPFRGVAEVADQLDRSRDRHRDFDDGNAAMGYGFGGEVRVVAGQDPEPRE